jgi:hypothetical protein
MNIVCELCGSINVRRIRSTPIHRLLRLFTGRKRFFCVRCGWTALRAWDEEAPRIGAPKKHDLKLVGVSAHAHHAEMDRQR